MLRLLLVSCFLLPSNFCFTQYNWKLEKQKNGISVYLSDVKESSFKAVKVECNLTGTYSKLIALLINVSQFNTWIYNNKTSSILKQNSPLDFIYYSETQMPWPLSNRDAIIHLKINTDSLPRFLSISGSGEPDFLPKISGKVRVPDYKANWKITMPSDKTIQINYLLEINPGGSIPAWVANSFADKGPFGTFSKMAELLKN
jgi:hypothetical protein